MLLALSVCLRLLSIGLEPPDAMAEEILAGLKDGIDHKIIAQFAQMQMAAVDAGESQVMATLGQSSHGL